MISPSIARIFGNMSLIFDLRPTRWRSILDEVEPGTAEFDCMLAALLFDVIKKRALTHRMLRNYILHADPELTREVLDDLRALEGPEEEQDYRTLMVEIHDQMNRVLAEVSEDHVHLAEIVERWSGEASHEPPSTSAL